MSEECAENTRDVQDQNRVSVFGHSMGGRCDTQPPPSILLMTSDSRPRSSFSLPKESRSLQVCFWIRTDRVRLFHVCTSTLTDPSPSPDSNPTECQWGQKAFKGYLSSPEEGKAYDSTLLLSSWPKDQKLVLKVDYGSDDQFYKDGQLRPESLQKAVADAGREGEVDVQQREGYDHS